MKSIFITILFLILILIGCSEKCDKSSSGVLDTIFERKSVRSYKNETATKEQLETLVKAGMAAPTAVDKRPWEFIIIQDKATLKQLAEALPYAKMAEGAGSAIVVIGNLEKQYGGVDSNFWIMDCSAATQNILLAAEGMKLGAVWTAVYPDQGRIDAVKKILNIPDKRIPLNLIPVGIPTGTDKPKDKFNKDIIHYNKW